MITFDEALQNVLENSQNYGDESVELINSHGRILAETIVADRDFPPFDRSTKDGIAIRFDALNSQNKSFKVSGIAQAGSPQLVLDEKESCIEVMTGAIIPQNADTVVMYEHTTKDGEKFIINEPVKKGQNIHYQASDVHQDEILLQPGVRITAAEIGVLATVGKANVSVKKLPKVAVISTGNELVDVDKTPLPFQIRKSNSYSLFSLLENEKIQGDIHHVLDKPDVIKQTLKNLLNDYDVLLLSGGVSKGKYDFLPEAFDSLGVEKVFHKVLQRPGKPFWFGKHKSYNTTVFSFPGNPVSTFVNYHLYFKPWLNKTLGTDTTHFAVFLDEPYTNSTDLTLFVGVILKLMEGKLVANTITSTGSGDLLALTKADGFIKVLPKEEIPKGKLVPFIPTRKLV
ncbi:molybdopterin molybdotransferase MoeA [Muricauda sp. CAU 1633]|uniref:molybdopterin molybdotransferase MoeA n=1 Tax=Allomuricauda sp. CAU 1633 TaxID=2816036 RepID=UPI001A8FFB41|nr:molybdopterin molybdotransferase MoeA [Muricauda sp. CAU 1633]MBO0323222.1 molybdopterin molybdotransferase MoeA [Muricauda sp. CAU 1633]